jgi:hypothetical protein
VIGGADKAQPLLSDLSLEHEDGGRSGVVVVPTRVVLLVPTDQPRVDVSIGPNLLEAAALTGSPDEVPPPRLLAGQGAQKGLELFAGERHATRTLPEISSPA